MLNVVILVSAASERVYSKYDTRFYNALSYGVKGGSTWLSCIAGTGAFKLGKITNRNDLRLLYKPLVF